jgi:hypothetical protein
MRFTSTSKWCGRFRLRTFRVVAMLYTKWNQGYESLG